MPRSTTRSTTSPNGRRTSAHGDTYQTRQLSDGRTFEVLKNFPTREQFTADVAPGAVEWTDLTYFWLATVS